MPDGRFRNCSREPNRQARAYHSGETSDLAFVITLTAFAGRTLYAVGFHLVVMC